MKTDRWQIIDELLDEVLERPGPTRLGFIREKCGADQDLRGELESLLRAHENADRFMENPAIEVIARDLASNKHDAFGPIRIGATFDSYRIKKLIGEGGMGKIYLADDRKLNREVAIKILPTAFEHENERVGRFQRETRAISALNHPNIVTIYDVGTFEGTNFIATEYVEGKTLRQYVDNRESLRGTLNIIIQCCDALSSAHHAGIVHRDIKPENIIVRPDGYVKILDFGLAKLIGIEPDQMSDVARTAKGMILGTPAYMSPEQISNEMVDYQTDMRSIALILYELLTGVNPFKKETKRKTFKAILNQSPPPASSINPDVPVALDQILTRALCKDSEPKFESVSELRDELKDLKRALDTSSGHSDISSGFIANPVSFFRPRYVGFSMFFILVAISGGLVWYFYFQPNFQAKGIDWAKSINTPLTNQPGGEYFPSVSPDGNAFVFAAKPAGNYDIFLKRIGGSNEINLTESSPSDDTQPAFSPDGKLIAFRSDRDGGGIFVMEETGENPRRVSDFGFHPSWSPDGKHIAVSGSGYTRPDVRSHSSIWVVNTETGGKRKLVGEYAYQPAWSPNGDRIAFWFIREDVSKRDVGSVSLDGGEPEVISNSASANWNPVWSPDGNYLYYASSEGGNMAFWRVPIDELTGKALGDSEVVPTPGKFNGHLSFSRDGKRLVYVQMNIRSNIKAVEFDPELKKTKGEAIWITEGDQVLQRPRLSPDGRKFVANVARLPQDDIIVFDRDGKNQRDITNDEYFDRYPDWSFDGKRIAFVSDRSGIHQTWTMNPDGSDLRKITKNKKSASFPVWAPEGNKLQTRIDDENYIVDLENPDKPLERKLTTITGFQYIGWDWSPDGTKIAGRWREHDQSAGLGYYSLETDKYNKLWTGESTMPRWLPDNRSLIISYQGKVHIFDTGSKTIRHIAGLPEENVTGVGVSRNGKLLYFTVESDESNIWLLDFGNAKPN